MPGYRTALSSTVMTASARWRVSPGRTSCRSRARATSCTASSPPGTLWPRWPRRCWARRSGRWRSPTTARMVSVIYVGSAGLYSSSLTVKCTSCISFSLLAFKNGGKTNSLCAAQPAVLQQDTQVLDKCVKGDFYNVSHSRYTEGNF